MENRNPVEKREHSRVPLEMDIDVCLLSGEDMQAELSIISCRGRDVSGGGVSFFGTTQYPHHSVLRLRILLSGTPHSDTTGPNALLKVMGKVMWSKKNGADNTFITGVKFLNIYEQDFHILNEYVLKNSSGGS